MVGIHEERSLGAAGVLNFKCTHCKETTVQVPTSPSIASGKKKGELQELNLRVCLASVVAGMSENGAARFLGILGMPSLEKRAWQRAIDLLIPALETVGDKSCRTWLERERALALPKAPSLQESPLLLQSVVSVSIRVFEK